MYIASVEFMQNVLAKVEAEGLIDICAKAYKNANSNKIEEPWNQ
jgi:hypothetical protein